MVFINAPCLQFCALVFLPGLTLSNGVKTKKATSSYEIPVISSNA